MRDYNHTHYMKITVLNKDLQAENATLKDHIALLHAAIRALGDYEGSDDEMFNALHDAVHDTSIKDQKVGISDE